MSIIEKELAVCVTHGPSPVVKLSGQASFRNRDTMCEAFDKLIAEDCKAISADLSELDYIDSSAVSALVKCAIKASQSGSIIEIVGASPHVSRILTLCGAAFFFKSRLSDVPSCSDPESGPPTQSYWHVSHFRLPATPAAASLARARISELTHSLPISTRDRQDLITAAGEALSNAIKHGCDSSPLKEFSVKCVAGPSRIFVDITDPGPGFDPSSVPTPVMETLPTGGIGIFIMRQLMDDVSFHFSHETRVRLVKNIHFSTASKRDPDSILIQPDITSL